MRKRKSDWIKQFREILRSIDKQLFSSHDFIGKFCKMYEPEWKHLLERYETGANQKVNAHIARMLSLYAKDVPVQKIKGLKPSKNIHAATSKVHWWKKVTVLLLLFMASKIIYAEEYNQPSTFLQHIEGWEWVYMEQGCTKQIKTPYYSVTYKEYDSHPEYRVVFEDNMYEGMKTSVTIYDTNGNLVRQLAEVPGWYKYSDVKKRSSKLTNKELYHIAHGENVFQSLTKLPSFFPYVISDEKLLEDDYNNLYEVGKIKQYRKLKKSEIRAINELNTQITAQHMKISYKGEKAPMLYCRFDSVFIDSLYNEICKSHFSEGFKKALWIIDANETGIRRKRLQLNIPNKIILIDSLCHRQMVADYFNNTYDVKTKENKETLMAIEQELGIKNKKNNVNIDSLAFENSEVYNDVGKIKCEMMGLPNDEKYYTMGEAEIRKEIQKYHPNWTTLEIGNRYLAAIQRVTEYLASSVIMGSIVSSASDTSVPPNEAAYNYLNFLIEEYWFVVNDIQRIDATTFEATIEIAPRGTLYKIIIQYRQTKPYEYVKEVRIVS